ncbi:semaphorin-5B-like [Hydractinia symbiolongicarpus]|uniref:semaphorin-5B-like n=1 Tax=Hydractinia symbiolongicarpus TaxID=13093 RepID=UPI00254F08D2|nr:semaphorin-5B-like [Hydractinia symbiolongicarpus]
MKLYLRYTYLLALMITTVAVTQAGYFLNGMCYVETNGIKKFKTSSGFDICPVGTCTNVTDSCGYNWCNICCESCHMFKGQPQNGNWSNWTTWSACYANHTSGIQYRFRTCTSPAPLFGGQLCQTKNLSRNKLEYEHRQCNVNYIANWNNWHAWSYCFTHRGKEIRYRRRTCLYSIPLNGGRLCETKNLTLSDVEEDLESCKAEQPLWNSLTLALLAVVIILALPLVGLIVVGVLIYNGRWNIRHQPIIHKDTNEPASYMDGHV